MRFSFLLIPLLLVFLAPRVWAGNDTPAGDEPRLLADISSLLEGAGYSARFDDRITADNIQAEKHACRMSVIGEYTNGERISVFERIQPDDYTLHMFYRGERMESLPRLRPAVEFYLQRHLARLDIDYPYQPLILLAENGECALEELDFSGIAVHADK